jgi:ankyrin repeat protein
MYFWQCNGGKTALHYAVKHGNEKAVEWLLNKGANLWIKSASGKLPFPSAIKK